MVMNLMADYRNSSEQDLVSDLLEEAIDQRGVQVHYVLRDMLNPDYLLGEATRSQFKESYSVPVFVESIEHFNGNGDIFDSFGLNYTDSAIFQVGSRRFKLVVGDLAEIDRPREGDLIYLPFSDSLWEITKVKMDLKYFQMGKNHSYRLVCKLFTYSHEEIDIPSDSDFNEYSSVDSLNSDHLKTVLGIQPDGLREEKEIFESEIDPIESFNPDNPFAF